jgi:ABC-type amino acid transport substrate-binding protein
MPLTFEGHFSVEKLYLEIKTLPYPQYIRVKLSENYYILKMYFQSIKYVLLFVLLNKNSNFKYKLLTLGGNTMKKALLALTIIFSLVMMAACGQTNNADAKQKVLTMATSADFAPFESRDPSGKIIGFDVDLANYIAKDLGYKLEIKDMKFDGLIGALQAKRTDIVLAGMSATEKRKQNVDFSTPYNHSGEMFITLKDSSVKTVDDLKGNTVGVQLGTIQEEGAKNLQKTINFDLKPLDNATTLIQELLSKRIQVAYMDKSVAKGYIAKQGLAGFDDPTSSSPGMAVAFPKGSKLVADVNKVLAKMEKNGKMQGLKDKWLKDQQ